MHFNLVVELSKLYAHDPVVKFHYNFYDMDREEIFETMIKKIARLRLVSHESGQPPTSYEEYEFYGPPMNALITTSLHHGMFETILRILGSEEQVKEYLPKVLSYKVLGCYAQTEMGHGSDVQSLQTEAVYDNETDQFIVNTPTILAAKFWPGELGKFADHCVFHAKMIIDGESCGIHAFLARIRDDEAHRPLKGLEIGDVGPKYGYSTKDNGYMIFKDFKVPRSALLSRFVNLNSKGELDIRGDPKVAYSTMLYVRVSLMDFTWKINLSILLVGIRYTLFRKQFRSIDNSKEERKVFDYQATQYQMMPFLSFSFACIFASKRCSALYEQMREEIKNDNFTTMKDLHSIVSAFKGLHMPESLNGLFKVRECCGAHGYSNYSNIPNIIEIWSPNVTLEGDTMVMYQQTAKGFLKKFRIMKNSGKTIKGIYSYMNEYRDFSSDPATFDINNSDDLLLVLKIAVIQSLNKISELLPNQDDKVSFDIAWNRVYQIDVISTAHLNAHLLNALMFDMEMKSLTLSAPLKKVMNIMLKLYLSDILVSRTFSHLSC